MRLRPLASILVFVSGVVLVVALFLPTVVFQKILSKEEVYSILTGVKSLWDDGNWILATIVFAFSVGLPVAKHVLLLRILAGKSEPERRSATAHLLQLIGKWSMLDVFIIALFVGTISSGSLAASNSRIGIHLFSAAVIVSMVGAWLVTWIETGRRAPLIQPDPALRGWPARLLSTAAFATFIVAVTLPLWDIKESFVTPRHTLGLTDLVRRLTEENEVLLGTGLALLVVGTTFVRGLFLMRLRWLPGSSPRTVRTTLILDEWSMLAVFALGIAVVFIKLDELTTANMLAGYWTVIGAAALCELDAWLLRRSALER